jgi:hypothetical protein
MGQGASATRSLEGARLGVYFQRDTAGLSNLRMQLESLMAICKVFKRFLVLPPPQRIHHLEDVFHETRFWSMSHLASHVPIVLSADADPPMDALVVSTQLASCHLASLPLHRHWYFSSAVSRIQHFEALPFSNGQERRDAAACVFESFELDGSHHRAAERILRRAGLKKHGYAAVHLRRGDFRSFRPAGFRSAEDVVQSLRPHVQNRVVVVATDAAEDDADVAELKRRRLPGAIDTIFVSSLHDVGDDALVRAAVEMLICRWGEVFVGTHESTFTNGIFQLRKKDAKTVAPELDEAPRLLFGQQPQYASDCRGVCWDRLTEFRALPSLSPLPVM